MNNYRILIADDHSVVRQGISILLRERFDDVIISHCGTFSEALSSLKSAQYDLLILDISIPEGRGVQMLQTIRKIQPEISVLIFSAYDEELYGLRYLMAGADGYVNKLSTDDDFKNAIMDMRNKKQHFSEETLIKSKQAGSKELDNPLKQLSPREMEIARLMIKGEGNLEIANRLNLQNSTVSTYKNRIFEKLDINNPVALFEIFTTYSEEYES